MSDTVIKNIDNVFDAHKYECNAIAYVLKVEMRMKIKCHRSPISLLISKRWLDDELKGSVPNGTKLSLFSTIFTPVFYLFHFVPWCG